LCLKAGLGAARAYTQAGKTLEAREVYGVLDSGLRALLASTAEDAPERPELLALGADAQLGEGFVLIAAGQHNQAVPFFQARLQGADGGTDPNLRFGATLGLAEARFGKREYEAARELFAEVAALDFTDGDRRARALVMLAECYLNLPSADSKAEARKRLTVVSEHYGDTPSARVARETLQTRL